MLRFRGFPRGFASPSNDFQSGRDWFISVARPNRLRYDFKADVIAGMSGSRRYRYAVVAQAETTCQVYERMLNRRGAPRRRVRPIGPRTRLRLRGCCLQRKAEQIGEGGAPGRMRPRRDKSVAKTPSELSFKGKPRPRWSRGSCRLCELHDLDTALLRDRLADQCYEMLHSNATICDRNREWFSRLQGVTQLDVRFRQGDF